MKSKLFQPFFYIAGAKALLVGLAAMALTAFIGYFTHTHFDGLLDVHAAGPVAATSILYYFGEQFIVLVCGSVVFYSIGLMFSKSSIRFIDVAGTMAFARWPMIFPAIAGAMVTKPFKDINDVFTAPVIITGIISLVFTIWLVALMYHAFSVCCNLKGTKAVLAFIGALLLAEVIDKLLCVQMYKSLHF